MKKDNSAAAQAEQTEEFLAKAKANQKTIIGISIGVIVLAVILLACYFVAQKGSANADEAIARADMEMNDSIATELYRQAATCGYKSGNRAKAEMGIRLYQEGQYAEAAEYLSDCSMDDKVVSAGVATLEGDCYVNLEQYDKAIRAYNHAISEADGNPQIVPFVLVKEANVYRAQGNYAKEADAYRTILEEYPAYNNMTTNIRALYERAAASSARN